ncbi:MAG TPA: neutral/alkaline non-lysosomal ceramidase N-terminal domain-containing protein, partial [Chloroflexota bacterium]
MLKYTALASGAVAPVEETLVAGSGSTFRRDARRPSSRSERKIVTTLLAGVSSVDVTPPVGIWQCGYGARTRPSETIRDDLRAAALVLEVDGQRAVLVSVDVIALSRDSVATIRHRIAGDVAIPAERVLLACSHTHGGPVTLPLASQPCDDDYVRILEKTIAGAVAMAARQMVPARLTYGDGHVGFSIERRVQTANGMQMLPNPEGPIDRRLRVLRVDSAAERAMPLAVLFGVCCHATCFGANNYAISGDYPAAARRCIEHMYHGETRALFLPGAFGDVRPDLVDVRGRFRGATDIELERIGRAVGAEAVRVSEELSGIPREPGTGTPRWEGEGGLAGAIRDVPLFYQQLPSRDELLVLLSRGDGGWARRQLAQLDQDGQLPAGEPCEVQALH